jgi:hypothetical protein
MSPVSWGSLFPASSAAQWRTHFCVHGSIVPSDDKVDDNTRGRVRTTTNECHTTIQEFSALRTRYAQLHMSWAELQNHWAQVRFLSHLPLTNLEMRWPEPHQGQSRFIVSAAIHTNLDTNPRTWSLTRISRQRTRLPRHRPGAADHSCAGDFPARRSQRLTAPAFLPDATS